MQIIENLIQNSTGDCCTQWRVRCDSSTHVYLHVEVVRDIDAVWEEELLLDFQVIHDIVIYISRFRLHSLVNEERKRECFRALYSVQIVWRTDAGAGITLSTNALKGPTLCLSSSTRTFKSSIKPSSSGDWTFTWIVFEVVQRTGGGQKGKEESGRERKRWRG